MVVLHEALDPLPQSLLAMLEASLLAYLFLFIGIQPRFQWRVKSFCEDRTPLDARHSTMVLEAEKINEIMQIQNGISYHVMILER